MNKLIHFCLHNRLIVLLLTLAVIVWGLRVLPFDWDLSGIPRSPIAVDAIPDIGENQQIVFTEWMGRSPQDVEDQITYPLTAHLLGIPGVRTVRSYSYFGYSSIYLIFEEDIEFYWSRSRILERLASLEAAALPRGVSPALGPDATPLGQVFWYTLEGRDEQGKPTGGWDLDELRSIQDFYLRYALQAAHGVAEVASVGGFVREYQVDVDPDAMHAYGISLPEVISAIRRSNVDVGARTIELNSVEYVVRGLGFIKSLEDIEQAAITSRNHVPVQVKDIANVTFGPALRRGALDKEGAEVVGGVVAVRFGENPLQTINNVKAKIAELSTGLPQKTLADGTRSQVTVVPFYDRSGLIHETLSTLNLALSQEILVTVIVIVAMLLHLGSSLLIAGLLPIAILVCFVLMKVFQVDANIVALTGIAIAIGTMVDMGIILCENILVHLKRRSAEEDRLQVIYQATLEVSGAMLTAITTTIISFLPVFTMEAAEGKLFRPLAYTKTFALIASILVSLLVIPAAASVFFRDWPETVKRRLAVLTTHFEARLPQLERLRPYYLFLLIVTVVVYLLADSWRPLGPQSIVVLNAIIVAVIICLTLYLFKRFERAYPRLIKWCLAHKKRFLVLPLVLVLCGTLAWSRLGKEFMPALDEGSFLYMPTTMPHASIGEALDILKKLDIAISNIPEVESVVGKLGRADTALDPAPISMFEHVVNYKPEYFIDDQGDATRQWREHIRSPEDIWKEIVRAAQIPGVTGAPKLQPIAARIVMLQSGMRAPMGVKIKGPTLETIEEVGFQVEKLLKTVPSVEPLTVVANRVIGKPFLEIEINREEIARYGLSIQDVTDVIEVALGGKALTQTVEGRERYPVRIRYARELRDRIDTLGNILISTKAGEHVPLGEVAEVKFEKKAQVIASEDTFLVSYVVFDMKPGNAEVDVVQEAERLLAANIASGEIVIPPGVSYSFAGTYENQLRSEKTLMLVIPVALLCIFLVLYLQFRSTITALLVFSGILTAWAGGFVLLWLYGQGWFMNISLLGFDLREFLHVRPYNLSVAVWVGFLALFGIASDDGVLIATYIKQRISSDKPTSVAELRRAVSEAGCRRIRPALMTTATTLLALLPVLTSTGRGSDIMVPMAIPVFGGMLFALITVFVVPVLYCAVEERKFVI